MTKVSIVLSIYFLVAMNLYTQWQISPEGKWYNCKPVDFDVLPAQGWFKHEGFDWDKDMQKRSPQ